MRSLPRELKESWGQIAIGAVIVFNLLWLALIDKVANERVIELLILTALAIFTWYYAQRTAALAKATRELAASTSESVVEAQKQRYLASQPWVFAQPLRDDDAAASADELRFLNVGNGPALSLRASIALHIASEAEAQTRQAEWAKGAISGGEKIGPAWPYLQPNKTVAWPNAFEGRVRGQTALILAEYQDIYGRLFLSGWGYRVEQVENDPFVVIPTFPLFPKQRMETRVQAL